MPKEQDRDKFLSYVFSNLPASGCCMHSASQSVDFSVQCLQIKSPAVIYSINWCLQDFTVLSHTLYG